MTDITELAQRMKAAAEKATPGEWWADEVKNEGCYGSGDDCVEGFTSYAIYGSDGQTLFDSLNSDAACICEEYDGEGHVAWDETAQRNAEFIALANPANILALVEALEKAQGAATQQGNIASALFDEVNQLRRHADEKAPELRALLIEADSELEALHQRITELESSGVAPGILRCTECSFVLTKNIISVTADTITTVESEPEPCPNGCGQLQPVTWKALAIQLMFTTKQGLSDLLEAKKRIEELESDLSEWTDCKHDGATYYDMSGQERCGRCGADV